MTHTKSQVIVFGNEKGGTGKSTLAFHTCVGLSVRGKKICSVDVDGRQGTLSRYIDNRTSYGRLEDVHLSSWKHIRLDVAKEQKSAQMFDDFLHEARSLDFDVVVVDTPGFYHTLSSYAHSFADVIVTPINDSYVDLDVFFESHPHKDVVRPSVYAMSVWEQRQKKMKRSQKALTWCVVRNRLSPLRSRNQQSVEKVLKELAKKLSFTVLSGFTERTIFREFFSKGLTLFDVGCAPLLQKKDWNISCVAARREMDRFLNSLESLMS